MSLVNLGKIWTVARMEIRHTRRLVRYWVFLSIAYLLGIGFYVYYSVLHALFSSVSASVGMIGPRYLMGAIALYYLTGFVLGIVFLGFDVRARDVRENIVEVLDSRPLTNLELIAGRFVALFLAGWLPIVILVLLIQGLGLLLPLLGSPIGRPVEPVSLVNFVFLMALPAVAFAIGLVFCVTLLVRHRLVAALVSIAVVVGLYWMMFTVSAPYAPFVDFLGVGQVSFPSDIVPGLAAEGGWPQRIGVLVLGLGLASLAAAIHPRLDGGRRWHAAMGSAALVAVGLALPAVVVQQRFGEVAQIEQWRSAHAARAGEPVADIESIAGSVGIDPGRALAAELELELRAPADESLSHILLTLNPGLAVDEVTDADGRTLTAEQADGLLDIELGRTLAPGERASLTLHYRGRPDTRFGYLDSVLALETVDLAEAQVGVLGYERGLFDRRYVALMPGIRWLPASGVEVGRDDVRTRRRDYFRADLEVEVPSGWIAAGPGERRVLGSDPDSARFRFAPKTSVPEVALLASEFESFATEIDGVTFEVLVHPDHDANFDVLADARDEVEQWVADRLELAAEAGLAYPFDAFTVVEVPNTLRSYKGGWRLDTALAPPSMMLVRETGFPTARFDYDLFNARFFGNSRDFDREGGKARIDRDRLISFFSNDFSGGNLFTGAARSFFAHRASAFGPDAIGLEFALDELATMLVSGQRSYFSVHLFTNINQAATTVISGMQGRGARSVTDAVITVQTERPEVWEAALETPLSELDPWQDPQRTVDVLTLKGGEMAEAIFDALGAERVGELFAKLLERHAGASFTLDDLAAAGESVDADLGPLLEDWLGNAGMPGFLAEEPELYRLPDGASGESRYQLLVRVTNGEPVAGFTRVAWAMQAEGASTPDATSGDGAGALVAAPGARVRSDPIRMAGDSTVEFGVVLSEPPAAVYVEPYLALNRASFLAGLISTTQIPSRDTEPFDGVREIAFDAGGDDRIVADDLDDGFAILTDESGDDLRLAGRDDDTTGMDRGLPVATGAGLPSRWSRRNSQTSWGRYRHTLAYRGAGDGSTRAVLPASIPSAGLWELEFHLPFIPYIPAAARGTWNLEIVSDDGREPVTFDASVGVVGWNLVGQFRLPAGEVRVEISDQTDGRLVVVDAIAWSPIR
jgi:ABC-type transport system involved in multi-copper enzyme maturation permease subunit